MDLPTEKPRDFDYSSLARDAARIENTPELQFYWEKRFLAILEFKQFEINNLTKKTLQLDIVSKPFTSAGFINLPTLIDAKGLLDEEKLQSTIEAGVRLLDNIIEILKFNSNSQIIVQQFRKVALGVNQLDEYLVLRSKAHNFSSKVDEIDYLGNLISNGAYRASESIAEEKGSCTKWDTLKYILRPKTFEYWYHQKSGEIRNGLEMGQSYTQENVIQSGFEIIPRRNSNILVYPVDEDWAIWSDREIPSLNSESLAVLPDNEESYENSIDKISSDDENNESIINNQQIYNDEEIYNNSTQESKDPIQSDPVLFIEESHIVNDELNSNPNFYNSNKQILSSETDSQTEQKVLTTTQDSNTQFQIGELVVISKQGSPFYNQVAQIIHISDEKNPKFQLKSTNEFIEDERWISDELASVDLFELLTKINTEDIPQATTEVKIVLMAVNTSGSVLVWDREGLIQLPSVQLPLNSIPEHALAELMLSRFGVSIKNIFEIGSSVEFATEHSPFVINLCFGATILEQDNRSELRWVDFRTVQFSFSPSIRVLCNKYNRNQLHQLTPQAPIIDQTTTTVQSPVASSTSTQTLLPMSNYILKLEKIIESNVFGEVMVTLQYDNSASPVTISQISGKELTPELNYFAQVVAIFCNALLLRNTSGKAISELIHNLDSDNHTIPMQTLLNLVSTVLLDLPENLDKITVAQLLSNKLPDQSDSLA